MAQMVATQVIERKGLARLVEVGSAGTHASSGAQPDGRARTALEKRGYKIGKGKSRRIGPGDFERFDLILAMDRSNLKSLQDGCPAHCLPKLKLFLQLPSLQNLDEVPDPYYGNAEGFERVLDLCEAGVDKILADLDLR
jgi:protein-tyrosine phosphatase